MRQLLSLCLVAVIIAGPVLPPLATAAVVKTATPIKHIVIIFGENRSFDHYFGTYPNALNLRGEPQFHAARNTPTVNGLSNALLNHNPNLNPLNGSGAANPFRFDRSQANTQDMGHDYMPEQLAFDGGAMDLFPANTPVNPERICQQGGQSRHVAAEWVALEHAGHGKAGVGID